MKQKIKWKKFISLLLTLCMALSMFLGVCPAVSAATPNLAFNDLDGFEWAADALMALKNAKIIKGDPSGNFYPGGTITRARFAQILCIAFKLPMDTNAPSSFPGDFTWNEANQWAIPCIEAAKQYFYYSGNSFNPGANLTREQIAFTIVKVLGLDTSGVSTAVAQAKYSKDWASINDAYKPAVALATNLGILSGNGNGSFNPTVDVKRAEMAVLLYRAINFSGGTGGGKFPDVKPGDWYYNAVVNLVNRDVLHGYQDGTFKPDANVTNDILPVWISRILGRVSVSGPYDPMSDSVVTSKLPDGFVSNSDNVTRESVSYAVYKLHNLPVPQDVDGVLLRFSDQSVIDAVYRSGVASVVDAVYNKVPSVEAAVFMNGSYDGSGNLIFNPAGPVTRGELAVMTVNALPKSGKNANVPGQVFSDVAPSDWFYDGVMYLYNKGILSGYPDGRFLPLKDDAGNDTYITRAMLASLICRILGAPNNPDPAGFNFTDPEFSGSMSWAKGLAWAAKDYLIIEGTSFYPARNATREELAYAAAKLFNSFNADNVNYSAILASFIDKDAISDVYKPAVAFLVSTGVIKGDGSGNLIPKAVSNRAMAAVFLARALKGIDISKMKDYQDIIEAVKQEGVQ